VVYQLYPPSFASYGGGGPSVLRGIISRIPYLACLGVEAVWLTPFSPAGLADGGYAADDYPGADPPLGTLADFDEMTAGLHANGIKVIVDFVPDHHFDLLEANWNAGEFLRVITDSLVDAQRHGASATWVLERGLGLRRARAATLLMLALPGSACLWQGEELGLHEVADSPAGRAQDPACARSGTAETADPACARSGTAETADPACARSGAAELAWFGRLAVEAQEHDPTSTLALYRQALGWRRKLQAAASLEWMPGTSGQVLHFGRPGGWRSLTNFGPRPVPLPNGTVLVASGPLDDGLLPADTTAWVISGSLGHRFQVAAATSAAPRVLITRSGAMPACSARVVPLPCQSS
jgi:glycosidase